MLDPLLPFHHISRPMSSIVIAAACSGCNLKVSVVCAGPEIVQIIDVAEIPEPKTRPAIA